VLAEGDFQGTIERIQRLGSSPSNFASSVMTVHPRTLTPTAGFRKCMFVQKPDHSPAIAGKSQNRRPGDSPVSRSQGFRLAADWLDYLLIRTAGSRSP
jgi:hypothetical protein